MRLDGRVARLERAGQPRLGCARCGGRGMPGLAVVPSAEAPARARGCPACGRASQVTRVVLPERAAGRL